MELCEACNRFVIRETPIRRVGDLEMDVENRRVTVGGTPVRLQRGEFAVLARLMSAPGMLFSSWDILEIYCAGNNGPKKDIAEYSENSALRLPNLIVFKIRQKIGAHRIETVVGCGYRLVAHPEKTS